jgi:hypothetical protein
VLSTSTIPRLDELLEAAYALKVDVTVNKDLYPWPWTPELERFMTAILKKDWPDGA